MSPPRRPPAGRPGTDGLDRLKRLLAEGGTGRRTPPRRRPDPDDAAPDDDVAHWAPGEEWHETQAFGDEPRSRGRRAEGWWEDGPPSRPLSVEGGLAARTQRGPIGASWWSRRFLAAIEATIEGGRPDRGRSYARRGQVMSLEVGPGVIEARVQGSRPEPYRVQLSMPVVAEEDWAGIVGSLAARAGYAARMLAGDLPHEVEEVFAAQGCSLFPVPGARLITECSCPDWANPCKHVAAVCYLVAEAFDDDPFAVLAWRGRDREAVLAELRRLRTGAAGPAPRRRRAAAAPVERGSDLAAEIGDWWRAGAALAELRVRPAAAAVPAAVLRRVPTGVLRVGGKEAAEVLAPAYDQLVAAAARRALGDG